MTLHQEDNQSYLRLAQIHSILQESREVPYLHKKRAVENVLEKKVDINYKIPLNRYFTDPTLIGPTALHMAATKNEMETVDILLKNNANVFVQDQKGCTALHQAVYTGYSHEQLINIILSNQLLSSVTSNPCDVNGLSHFHIACLYKHSDAVKFFLNNGVSTDITISSDAKKFAGYAPLHFAAESAAVSVIRILLDNNAKTNVKDARGWTPLHLLLKKKIDFLDFQGYRKKPNHRIITSIENATDLLFKSSDVDDIGLTQFHIACTQRDVSLVEYYLQKNIDINEAIKMDSPIFPGYTAFHFAARCNINIAKKLLEKNANFEIKDAKGVTPMDLLWRIYTGVELYYIFEQKFKYLMLSDRRIRLLDFLKSAQNPEVLRRYLQAVNYIDIGMSIQGPECWRGRTMLHFAVLLEGGQKMIVECMSQALLNSLINKTDILAMSPIHLAFRLHKTGMFKVLTERCNHFCNMIDHENLSHLHIACAMGNYEMAERICPRYQADRDSYRGKETYGCVTPGSTALHVAANLGQSNMVDMLIKHGFDLEAKDDNGKTPLDLLFQRDDAHAEPVSRIILRTEAITDDMIERMGFTRLHMAIHCDYYTNNLINERNIKTPIKCRDSSSFLYKYDGCTPLLMAMMRNTSPHFINYLIKESADLLFKNQQGSTPLYSALAHSSDWPGLPVVYDILLYNETLRRQVEEMSGITMLHIACYTVDRRAVLGLLTGQVDVNARVRSDCPIWAGWTPLYALAKNNKNCKVTDDICKIVEVFLKAGADMTALAGNNETPIHLFTRNGTIQPNYAVLKLLIQNLRIYDVNPADRDGVSYFHTACLVNNVEVVESFLKNGVDVNQPVNFFSKNFAGMTPLQLAVFYENEIESKRETIRVLLTNGADIKAEDSLGQTALHKAVKLSYSLSILEILIRHGAAVEARDVFGQTPLELLLKTKMATLKKIAFFEEHGCRLHASNPFTDEGYISALISLGQNYNSIFLSEIINAHAFTPDDMGRNLIHNIVTTNNPDCKMFKYDDLIKSFLLAGVDIDLQDKKGRTALHLAAQFENDPAVMSLLINGADVNVIDAANMTPLNYAIKYCPKAISYEKVIRNLVIHVRKLQLLNLKVNPNNIWEREEPSSFVCGRNRNLNLSRIQFHDPINYQNEIEAVWSVLVNEYPRLILGDFLSETGRGLILYSVVPTLRNKVDEFFRTCNNNLKDVCALQHRKAVKRVSLVETAVDSMLAIAGSNFPIVIIEMIFRELTNTDLVNLIKGTVAITQNIVTIDSCF